MKRGRGAVQHLGDTNIMDCVSGGVGATPDRQQQMILFTTQLGLHNIKNAYLILNIATTTWSVVDQRVFIQTSSTLAYYRSKSSEAGVEGCPFSFTCTHFCLELTTLPLCSLVSKSLYYLSRSQESPQTRILYL